MQYITAKVYDNLPKNVKLILDKSVGDSCYDHCKKQIKKLNKIGWDADYGLDGLIHSIGKL